MARAADEYRELMMAIFAMKQVEAEDEINKCNDDEDNYHTGYMNGYLAGLIEAHRTIEASKFLTE